MGNEQGNYQNRPGDYSSSSRSFSNADPFSSLPSSAGASRPLPPPPPTSPKPAMPHSATYSSPFVSPPSRPSTASAAATSSSAQQTQAASSPQGEPLRFHKTLFGKNVTLTGDRIATRDPNRYCAQYSDNKKLLSLLEHVSNAASTTALCLPIGRWWRGRT